jgi:hypothetical protein
MMSGKRNLLRILDFEIMLHSSFGASRGCALLKSLEVVC